MRKLKKFAAQAMLAMLVLAGSVLPASAQEKSDTSSLEVSFITENTTQPMEGTTVRLYQLAGYDYETMEDTWKEDYQEYQFQMQFASDEEILSAAKEIASYAEEKKLEPDYEVKTDAEGKASITCENGIYLICGEKTTKGGATYTPTPCLVHMPYTDDQGTLTYKAEVELKYSKELPQSTATPKKTGTVQTGDDRAVAWIACFAASFVCLVIFGIYQLKTRKGGKRG